MRFSAVLFDFDGVLVDTEWAIYEAWHRTFRAHGHPLPLEIYTQCIGSDFDTWSPKTHLEELTGRSFDWHQLDEARQVDRHQAARILRLGVERFDFLERFLEAGQSRADRVDLGARGRRKRRPGPVEIGIEALHHLPVGKVRGRRARRRLGGSESEQRCDADGEADGGTGRDRDRRS